MKIKELLESEVEIITVEEKDLLAYTPDEVGCGGIIIGGGSCGSNPGSTPGV